MYGKKINKEIEVFRKWNIFFNFFDMTLMDVTYMKNSNSTNIVRRVELDVFIQRSNVDDRNFYLIYFEKSAFYNAKSPYKQWNIENTWKYNQHSCKTGKKMNVLRIKNQHKLSLCLIATTTVTNHFIKYPYTQATKQLSTTDFTALQSTA